MYALKRRQFFAAEEELTMMITKFLATGKKHNAI